MGIYKIVNDVITEFFMEDVGGDYLKRKYGMKTDFDDFEKKCLSQKTSNDINVIHTDGTWKLLKNPPSMDYVGDSARGANNIIKYLLDYIDDIDKHTI